MYPSFTAIMARSGRLVPCLNVERLPTVENQRAREEFTGAWVSTDTTRRITVQMNESLARRLLLEPRQHLWHE